ncbi:bifunctional biotin--[acetyl-CoA-carboxylase] ligase/biotin operon repressor BirA [Vibrio splendidus]|uniref:bifunctional biotin--[acetyl-CoA-carboxylase] ligase/biotin operon repressor BirA n=1 Tax=Vibrio splendidus TaxID=29497 RepID=UPI000D3C8070|nr:bifunctional biotin--[acetyl-CoA-carboxylase] ligase/biotin operon repressor BirA [Vibrio splendidus]MCC4881094.1 bifunctional biotin--[acetyl-CoA-carboxylase] ligase/biotin operon repressor BirA [Vibrio splendidus]PTO56274.1 biotin--[acetyl-CoA-carboxylase] synthetase [Vibrio splendidus]PTO63201.1 biotin--[acetyl-CoA-carboxylase] synthetase [Vibrio splendidus]PTP82533.1 biotin--[acetyl-CoA-carboxylase] synthetase [Vibrio splendidus]
MREHSTKLALLRCLADGEFHSGEDLGEMIGVSRAAISKHIKGIQEWGLDIYRVQGKGYKLASRLDMLDQEKLSAVSRDASLELIPIIGSTNQHLLERTNTLESGSVCIAEYQAAGRGRRGREWVSPFGANLYLSMYWRLDAGMAAAMGLSLVVGVAVVEALEEMGVEGVKLKWPNDLYHNDKKLAGILVELSGQSGGAAHIVIGLGLNLSMDPTTSGIGQPWTSLKEVCDGKVSDRNQLAQALINAWDKSLADYELKGMSNFVERWNRLDNFLGRNVRLIIGPREIEGVVQGIDEQGAVLLKTESGIESYIGGEISLRKGD